MMSTEGVHPMHRFDEHCVSSESRHECGRDARQRNGGAQQAAHWSPYQDNGGTSLAVAGDDYAVLAADTRLSRGYSILSRNVRKWKQLTETTCIVSCGMKADIDALQKNLTMAVTKYIFEHRRPPSIEALSQLLSVTLYSRRFFPFYTFNLLAGINTQGKGVVYSYDAVGNTESVPYSADGSGKEMILSLLDTRLSAWNQTIKPETPTMETVVDLAKSALNSAAERDIATGDKVELVIITTDGIKVQTAPLRLD